ncbi:carboxymuconolactone decarboxylase family protein [Actinomadura graeca]|uniref:Carboxymuconolactone decarboxylase family protein n=1 Tax=Actinomadura graeca TaxID=2750812 RepID=A0ABX8R1U1_9ACTN|nr:carboxymuconolactone decarboxylase family protein [Actinomadura graeca]QXJ24995.1 carboxymuconolactone decarboxylase family protein [Actinomadura graeca]
MSRLAAVPPDTTEPRAAALLDRVEQALGSRPNMLLTMATSPAVLDAYLAFSGALAGGHLSATLREQLALTLAAENECGYCLAAHTTFGARAGLSDEEIGANARGEAADPRAAAALRFARRVVRTRGFVNEEDLAEVRAAGFGDGEIGEIVGAVALNVFTNYFNSVAQTDLDFPAVPVPWAED